MSTAYYNEIDPFAAAWLRELITQGHIAAGDVDQRSIEDVTPGDLKGYTQCHFFAGIGIWSLALRRASWPDSKEVWTGSCPCQPFSSAGKGAGFADERHLWPALHHLIRERRPGVFFGEQVASKNGLAWLDAVQSDLEAEDYAVGAVDLCAAGVGAPHIRQRLWIVAEQLADADRLRCERTRASREIRRKRTETNRCRTFPHRAQGSSDSVWLADAERLRLNRRDQHRPGAGIEQVEEPKDGQSLADQPGNGCEIAGVMANADESRTSERRSKRCRQFRVAGSDAADIAGHDRLSGPTNGQWRNADWLFCRDKVFRPVEAGTFPLADGNTARVGRLRGYGNAINAEVATEVIKAYVATRATPGCRRASSAGRSGSRVAQ